MHSYWYLLLIISSKLPKIGGATRDRTADLLHAMQALSQLSYSPNRQILLCYYFLLLQISGGATRDRTADLLHAMQALSQLSYSPAYHPQQSKTVEAMRMIVRQNFSVNQKLAKVMQAVIFQSD